eukprot:7008240-Alexandrium_andersonii.AAC.1
MQLEVPLHTVAASPTTSQAGGVVPDINGIDPEDDMEVDSDDLTPARPPGLPRAGGLPQAMAAALPARGRSGRRHRLLGSGQLLRWQHRASSRARA